MAFKRILATLSSAFSLGGDSPLGKSGWLRRVRFVVLTLLAGAATPLILSQVDDHYPIELWMFWRYASYWVLMLVFSVACLSAGHRLTTLLLPWRSPVAEHLVISFTLGVFTFFAGMFVAGLLGLYGAWFSVLWPVLMIAVGAWPLFRYARRLLRHVRWFRSRPRKATPLWHWPLLAYGLLSLAALYFVILSPGNISYDARWYHLAIAEHYAAYGGIERFHEGWIQGTNPQLSSYLYTWGFILPWTRVFDRAMTCAHLEYTLFLWTLAGIPPLVRRLLHGRRAPLAWVATFLFPGIFLYDSNLSVGADHVGAVWAIPIMLALLRAWKDPGPRRAVLVAIFVSAAMLTKYTVFILAGGPILAMAVRFLWRGIVDLIRKAPGSAKSAWLALGTFAATGIIATAPHWLKNWIWYGDPAYPALHKYFNGRPWTPDSTIFYQMGITDRLVAPEGSLFEKAWETLKVLFTFSFIPHNFAQFHGEVPIFGFLFTISTVLLVTFRRSARIWAVVLCTWIGLATWVSLHARDRYLQAILPWMVVVTASVLILAWRTHWLQRWLVAALVAVQVVWGGDVYFIRTHAIVHDSPIKTAVDFLAKGHEKKYEERLERFGFMEDIGETLPRDAKVLVHEENMTLGLQHRAVRDAPGVQGGLIYGTLGSVRELYDLLRSWGVTHVVWKDKHSRAVDSIGGDLLFFELAEMHTAEVKAFSSWRLGRLPLTPPEGPFPDKVAYFACGDGYEPGLYSRRSMNAPGGKQDPSLHPKPEKSIGGDITPKSLIDEAQYVVWHPSCQPELDRKWLDEFERVGRRGKKTDLYIRKPAARK